MNRHLLLFTSSLNLSTLALSSSTLLLILSCHLIFIILLRHQLWNTSIFLALPSFIFHASQPYMRTGLTKVLYSLIFVFLDTLLEFHTRFTNAPLAFPSLAFEMSSSLPRCLHTMAPRQINFSTSSNARPFTVMASLFLAFTLMTLHLQTFTRRPVLSAFSTSLFVFSCTCLCLEEIRATSSAKSRSSTFDVNFHLNPVPSSQTLYILAWHQSLAQTILRLHLSRQ